ncbi:pantetheine-phosphate adenylyltransferase, partial [Candidatus Bipolaricaulota bacterium]|nr:pantetheine-phosphate adenylyltransferase [Candidatus Bipolaricaulota bacterium]
MPKALYPGSFDPITYGHLDIIERAGKIFEDLIIGIVENPRKETLFTPTERKEITERALEAEEISVSKVITFSGLLVNCAEKYERESIVRGLRANSDFEYEFQMALTNRDLAPEIESVFLMTSGEYSFLSSSIVKEVKELGGDVGTFVPEIVEEKLA